MLDYLASPLGVAGEKADHVCAFARVHGGKQVLVVVPRLVVRLTGGQPVVPLGLERWQEARLVLPAAISRSPTVYLAI